MKIIQAKALEPYLIHLLFEDDVEGTVDLSYLAGKGVFSAWTNPGIFERISINQFGGIEWPNELDLCPDSLYMKVTGQSPQQFLHSEDFVYAHA